MAIPKYLINESTGTGTNLPTGYSAVGGDGLNGSYGGGANLGLGGKTGNNPYVGNNALMGNDFYKSWSAGNANAGTQGGTAPSTLQKSPFDPNNAAHAQAAKDMYSHLQEMINSGNEQGARDYYNQAQQTYGFTDTQMSPFAFRGNGSDGSKGYYSASDLQGWKNATAEPTSTNLGIGGPQGRGNAGANPYLAQMAQGITDQMNQNWSRNLAPSIRSGAMAAGGFGGSRQGVVEANGLNDLNRTLGQSLTSLYGQDWTNQQNRNLQQQQINNQNSQYFAGLDSNNAQFGQNLNLNTLNAMYNWAQGGVNNANNIQNQPINYFNGFNNNTNQTAGNGGTQTQTTGSSSDPLLGTAALLKAGGDFYDNYKKNPWLSGGTVNV